MHKINRLKKNIFLRNIIKKWGTNENTVYDYRPNYRFELWRII